MGLGSDLDISLAKARDRARAARELVLEGQDPVLARRAANVVAAPPKPVETFGRFAMAYLDTVEDGFKNAKHRQQWRSTLVNYATPMFDVPINEVDTDHVLQILQPIWLSKSETAGRLRGRIEKILDAAKVKGFRDGENPARGKGHLSLLLPKQTGQVKHHPALPFADAPAFMQELRKRPAMAARALEFTILTAARSGEARGMVWGEIDLDAKLWTVPAERMKMGKEHEIPLSDAALAILAAIKPENPGADWPVFVAPRGGAFSDMALSQLLKRMGHAEITVHGFRSTFRDWAGETTTHDREVVEMALAHTVGSNVELAYRRGRALEKRRDLMADWANFCLTGA